MSNKNKPKIYRFALYGEPGSGKTCLLATLAMPRYPHPYGHSCIWRCVSEQPNKIDQNEINEDEIDQDEIDQYVEQDEQDEQDEQVQDETDLDISEQDKYLTIQHRSQRWMRTAINQLSKRELPPSNPTDEEPFIFEFDFTAATHQTFRIELIDYSGELIDPNLSETERSESLRKKFVEMDGVLVLAEAPFKNPPKDQAQGYADLYPLRKAFSRLRCEKQTCAALEIPVALLINKWDRYSHIDYANPANEQEKLKEFLNATTPPPHKGVCDVLQYSVTKDNFKVFPVSAFGASESHPLDDSVERPKQVNPSMAFCLEDAFIWLAQRRDAIDLKQYQEEAAQNLDSYKKTGLELLKRYPTTSEQAKQINAVLQECQKVKRKRTIYVIIAIVGLWLMAETTMDMISYQEHAVTANSPLIIHKQVGKAEKWLTEYIAAPYFRHLISKRFITQEKAQHILGKLQTQRENFLWEAVQNAQKVNLQVALTPTSEYLKSYPYGSHAQEVQDIKQRAEFQWQKQKNEDAFRQLASQVQENQQAEKIIPILEKLRQLPIHPQAETEDMRQQRITLEKKMSDQLTQLLNQQKWEQISQEITRKVQMGEFLAAALLLNKQPDTHLTKDFKEDFKKEIVGKIEERVTHSLKTNDSLNLADKLLKEYMNDFPGSLQTQIGQIKIERLQNSLYERLDEMFYEAARTLRNLENIQKYLQEAPLKTMAKEISAYKAFLNRTEPSTLVHGLKLKLTQIYWEEVQDKNNTVSVHLNGKQVIYNNKVNAKHHSSTTINGKSLAFTAKPSDQITITIKVINEDIFFDDDYGHATVEKPIYELAGDYRLTLRNHKGVKTAIAFLEIEGYPTEPPLPQWQR